MIFAYESLMYMTKDSEMSSTISSGRRSETNFPKDFGLLSRKWACIPDGVTYSSFIPFRFTKRNFYEVRLLNQPHKSRARLSNGADTF